jgi:hypothetical protein
MAHRSKCDGRLVCALVLCAILLPSFSASAARPKRVLVVHSFVNVAPPFTTHSIAFETELTEKFGAPIDLDEVSLDVARYASLDMEDALVDFMRARQTKWQPDLVVPIGSPAARFEKLDGGHFWLSTTPDKPSLPITAEAAAVSMSSSDLRLTDTNSADDSKGRTWGLEGHLFWYVLGRGRSDLS